MKVIILIINYNNTNDLKKCIQSCLQLSFCDFQIVVIENGSRKEIIVENSNWIKNLELPKIKNEINLPFDKVKYIVTEKNLGFGNGNNFGFEWISKNFEKPNYIWLLNNDTESDINALSNLVDAMEKNGSLGFAGSLILDFYQRNIIQAAGGEILPWFGVSRHLLKGKKKESVKFDNLISDYQCGASILVRYSLIEQYGGFRPDYFLYFEESDWQYRMNKIGWSNTLVATSMVYHKEGASTKNLPKHFYYHYFYSAIKFSRLNFQPIQNITSMLSLILLLILRSKFKYNLIKEGLRGIYFALSKT